MPRYASTARGFTIVELLIVIVIIAILAAITVVAYNGIQNRAADSSVQSDLRNLANRMHVKSIEDDSVYPNTELALSQSGLKASKAGYGSHLVDSGTGFRYNLLYCSTVPSYRPSGFAFVAASKSGNVFAATSSGVTSYPASSWTGGWGTICPNVLGVSAGNSAAGVWLYENSIWKSWLN